MNNHEVDNVKPPADVYDATTPPRPLSAVHARVQDMQTQINDLTTENERLKIRISNQRRELRRLCKAQRLLREGERLGRAIASNRYL